ncbi:MAG: molybdenum cofactor guanylyltransferase, partial [Sphingomonadaceae bacterium]
MAGGQARRFGSDKALAPWRGKPLIAHVQQALAPQCAQLVVCGRTWADLPSLDDRPTSGLGPLGGICAALQHARLLGLPAVLSAPCDMPDLPANLAIELAPGPAVVQGQWLVGYWPVELASVLVQYLESGGKSAVHAFAGRIGARPIAFPRLRNINTPDD